MIKTTFISFCNAVQGFEFYSKETGYQIYKYEMYWSGLNPIQCFKKYDTKEIKIYNSYE